MTIVLVTILLPIAAGALLFLFPREDRALSRAFGAVVAAATIVTLVAGGTGEWSFRWLARPFQAAFHFGATPISFWIAPWASLPGAIATGSPSISCQVLTP